MTFGANGKIITISIAIIINGVRLTAAAPEIEETNTASVGDVNCQVIVGGAVAQEPMPNTASTVDGLGGVSDDCCKTVVLLINDHGSCLRLCAGRHHRWDIEGLNRVLCVLHSVAAVACTEVGLLVVSS